MHGLKHFQHWNCEIEKFLLLKSRFEFEVLNGKRLTLIPPSQVTGEWGEKDVFDFWLMAIWDLEAYYISFS